MTTLLIGLAIAGLLAAGVVLARLARRAPAPAIGADQGRLDTIAAWPPQPTRILSTSERIAFITLTRALPGHMVLAQVPLSRFLKVPKRHSHSEWLRRIGNQSVDLVVCDMASQVLAVVELHPAEPSVDERVQKRSWRIARTLEAAGIKLHVWTEGALPSVDLARDAILPKPLAPGADASPAKPPVEPPPAATTPDAGPASNPFDESDRDASQDELIELSEFNETPPSTWFDDLDSGPTPLQKPPRR